MLAGGLGWAALAAGSRTRVNEASAPLRVTRFAPALPSTPASAVDRRIPAQGQAAQEPAAGERLGFLRALASAADTAAPSPPPSTDRAPEKRSEDQAGEVAVAPSLDGVHVVVYTTSWCPVCKRAKEWMNGRRIAFEERDVESSRDNARKMHTINARGGVPTFDVEGQVLVGFNERDLLGTMQRAAERHRERPPW